MGEPRAGADWLRRGCLTAGGRDRLNRRTHVIRVHGAAAAGPRGLARRHSRKGRGAARSRESGGGGGKGRGRAVMAAAQGGAVRRAAAVLRPLGVGGGNKPVAHKPERISWPVGGARRPGALSKCVVPGQPRRGLLFCLRQQGGGRGEGPASGPVCSVIPPPCFLQ